MGRFLLESALSVYRKEEGNMTENVASTIQLVKEEQRKFFLSGKTRSLEFRLKELTRLENAIIKNQRQLKKALYQDLGKSSYESHMTEIGMLLSEIRYMKKNLAKWEKRRRVSLSIAQFPARGYCMREAYGCVLVIAPWNYPLLLSLQPVIGAIAAGNCVILKPSEYALHTSRALKELVEQIWKRNFVFVQEGGAFISQTLLNQRFDFIFYTGGERVGKLVLKKAARHLTPTVLELGGKSPCIVTENANIKVAVRRVLFGKCLNSGQTCVAPDYLLIQESIKEQFITEWKKQIEQMYGKNAAYTREYPSIIDEKHFERLEKLGYEAIEESEISEEKKEKKKREWETCLQKKALKIAPMLLEHISMDSNLMKEEIFGPILPIITYRGLEEVKTFLQQKEKPLALYIFTEDKQEARKFIKQVSFGGGCVNDTILHLSASTLPFGGVGGSGMGRYHGKYSYETFTHEKGILEQKTWFDFSIRYMPYKKWKKRVLKKLY